MSENKKIKNATVTSITLGNGSVITCKSKLETTIIKALIEAQEKDSNIVNIQYEPNKYVIFKGFKPTLPFYIKNKKTGKLENNTTKQIDVTYTPDVIFYYKNNIVLIEVKPRNMMNDVYPYKRKMFRKYLEDTYNNGDASYYPVYCQISSRKEVFELIEILKQNYNK